MHSARTLAKLLDNNQDAALVFILPKDPEGGKCKSSERSLWYNLLFLENLIFGEINISFLPILHKPCIMKHFNLGKYELGERLKKKRYSDDPAISPRGIYAGEMKMYEYINPVWEFYSSSSHKPQKLETTQMSFSGRMDKQTLVSYSEINGNEVLKQSST